MSAHFLYIYWYSVPMQQRTECKKGVAVCGRNKTKATLVAIEKSAQIVWISIWKLVINYRVQVIFRICMVELTVNGNKIKPAQIMNRWSCSLRVRECCVHSGYLLQLSLFRLLLLQAERSNKLLFGCTIVAKLLVTQFVLHTYAAAACCHVSGHNKNEVILKRETTKWLINNLFLIGYEHIIKSA